MKIPVLFSAGVGAAALLLAAEVLFRVLPVSTATMTGYYIAPDLLSYPPHHRWRVASGWDLRNAQPLTANNWGFLADRDFTPNAQAVALIGDSYVEASMLDPEDRPGAQLEKLLGDRDVYTMGTPGTALLDYAQRIRAASELLQVQDFVLFMQPEDAGQSLCGSGHVVSRCLDPNSFAPRVERQAASGTLKNLLRHSALAQYLMSQIRFKPAHVLRSMFRRSTPTEAESAPHLESAPGTHSAVPQEELERSRRMVDAVVKQFFLSIETLQIRKLVVVMDGPRPGLAPETALMKFVRLYLMESLRQQGVVVQDLQQVYAAYAADSRRSINVGPHDAHLNAIGVRLAMSRAAALLEDR